MLRDACFNDFISLDISPDSITPPPHYKPRSDGVKLINPINSADYKLIIGVFHTAPDPL